MIGQSAGVAGHVQRLATESLKVTLEDDDEA